MLTISLPATDELEALEVNFEHSLVSLSKWEENFEKPFFGLEPHSLEESEYYIHAMVLGPPLAEGVLDRFTMDDFEKIREHINAKRTGTTFPPETGPKGNSGEIITNELVYYWMVSFRIPFYPAETWHFNRLMTLIRVASVKQTKPKKMSMADRAAQQAALNEQRRKELGTSG